MFMAEIDKKLKSKEIRDKMWKEWDVNIFHHCWLLCVIFRVVWHLNWYVFLPEWHPLRWMQYSDWDLSENKDKYKEDYVKKQSYINDIEVHGWLTFDGWFRSVTIEWEDMWFCFGFDTAHAWDLYLRDRHWELDLVFEWEEYRDMDYVIGQTKKLAEQLSNFKL